EQKKTFGERPMGFGGLPQPGQLIATSVQDKMKLTDDQKKQLADLQKEADEKIDGLLKEDQKKQFKQMKDLAKGFAGPPGGGPPGGGFPGFGGGGGSGLFRAPRYAPDYPGLKDRELKPGKSIEELQAKEPPKETPKETPKDK